jgi:hypothetical protein
MEKELHAKAKRNKREKTEMKNTDMSKRKQNDTKSK